VLAARSGEPCLCSVCSSAVHVRSCVLWLRGSPPQRPGRHAAARGEAARANAGALLWCTRLNGSGVADVSSLLEKMKAATQVKRGDPGIKETVEGARDEMNRFVAYYRRNNKVAGAASFSTLYTAISTLSGHFQNYGPEYPVPAKRQKVAFPCPPPPFLSSSPPLPPLPPYPGRALCATHHLRCRWRAPSRTPCGAALTHPQWCSPEPCHTIRRPACV